MSVFFARPRLNESWKPCYQYPKRELTPRSEQSDQRSTSLESAVTRNPSCNLTCVRAMSAGKSPPARNTSRPGLPINPPHPLEEASVAPVRVTIVCSALYSRRPIETLAHFQPFRQLEHEATIFRDINFHTLLASSRSLKNCDLPIHVCMWCV